MAFKGEYQNLIPIVTGNVIHTSYFISQVELRRGYREGGREGGAKEGHREGS